MEHQSSTTGGTRSGSPGDGTSYTIFEVADASVAGAAITALIQAGLPGKADLVRGVMAGRFNLLEPARGGSISGGALKRMSRNRLPSIVLIGDDDYSERAGGPSSWTATAPVLRWARGGMVHASGGDLASYRLAQSMAAAAKRFVLIETSTVHEGAWSDALLAAKVPFVKLLPTNGIHPVAPPKGSQH